MNDIIGKTDLVLDSDLTRDQRECLETPASAPAGEPVAAEDDAARSCLDWADLMERLGGDRELVDEVTSLFRQEYPPHLARIRIAIDAQNAGALQSAAHALKGAAGNMSATAVAAAARTLETLAQAGDLTEAAEAERRLQQELTRLGSYLDAR